MKTEAEINAEKHAKPRVDIVPPALTLAAGRALGYGAAKHGVPEGYDGFGTWRIAGTEQAEPLTHYACLMRHMLLWRAGEKVDPESKLSHLDHAAAQLSILLDILERPPEGRGEPPEEEARTDDTTDAWVLPDGWKWLTKRESGDTGWCADQPRGGRVYSNGHCFLGSEPTQIVELVLRRNREDGGT